MQKGILLLLACVMMLSQFAIAQERTVLIPKRLPDMPLTYEDTDDIFGESYRWIHEGAVNEGAAKLRTLVENAGFTMDPNAYYVVVANFTDRFSPIGLFRGDGTAEDSEFLRTRMYGLNSDNLYFIFITREANVNAYVSVMATEKDSPFNQALLQVLGLFFPIPTNAAATLDSPNRTTYIDVRKFDLPEAYQEFSDLSFIVKKELSDEMAIASQVFDNTSLEQWSFGVATAVTSIDDVNIIIGADGSIIIEPKPTLDPAQFLTLNYHFSPFDSKRQNFGNSLHALVGIRLTNYMEGMVGVGASFDLGLAALGIFAGYSVEVANDLQDGFAVGDVLANQDVDPFKTRFIGKPRIGLQIKFP
ncbi:MAG: hypothetical protein ACRBF0_19985 [Calditrichia bacterium]